VRRLFLSAVLAATVALAATALASTPGRRSTDAVPTLPPVPTPSVSLPPLPPTAAPVQYVLRVGDTMQVEGGSLGCQVTRRAGRATIECRPRGALKGRYGTFLTHRTVTVARYRSSRTAKVVFTARHRGGYRVCGRSSRATQAAASCR
jgi:hypothetical protein